jgi:monoamine oxidase
MKTLIVGGGLSGLVLAESLESQGIEYLLVEARPRLGGRIMTHHQGSAYFDLGPAWFWLGQPRITRLVRRLNQQHFDQFSYGIQTFEDEKAHVQHGQGLSSMAGSLRVTGGFETLIAALSDRIPNHRKQLNTPVIALNMSDHRCIATLSDSSSIIVDQVVLCMPPRIAAQLSFTPELPAATMQAMQEIPTWMAGQAKAIAVYDTPFWRINGFSGQAKSRKGPMIEIHDASPADGGPYALFGFIGIPPAGREDVALLRQHLIAQLIRLFGPQAATPKQLKIQDWASAKYTATEADKEPMYAHPNYGLPPTLTKLWNNKLHFAGTEVAPTFGGYIEGALEAVENVLDVLN